MATRRRATRTFQIALVNRIPAARSQHFTVSVQNEITYTLWDLLAQISRPAGGFIPGPSWSLGKADVGPHDVVVYFVADPSRTLTGAARTTPPPQDNPNLGGWTAQSAHGVVSEVYLDGNLPARRLGKCAFHEIMHNKLDVGASVLQDLHTQGGGGLATPPTNEWTPLTQRNITLMAANLFRRRIDQFTGGMR